MIIRLLSILVALVILFSATHAQKAELTINFNETFFDALLESVFHNIEPLEFPIANTHRDDGGSRTAAYQPISLTSADRKPAACPQSVKLLREMDGVRTAVRFREGRVYVPLAFTGNYSPPFVGCVEFGGWAEANIDLEFDQAGQRVIGRARVLNVNLNGTGGLGGTVIARMIQTSIDKRLNPFEIISLEKMSFMLPIRGNGRVRAKATSVRPEIVGNVLSFHITYAFEKG
jgi:hypothetical protein